jgi:hypothetical protein
MVRAVGFDDVLIKPYPSPERIAFSVPEYQRFVKGADDVFPLNLVREDMKGNTNVILQKGKPEWDTRRPRVLNALLKTGETGPHRLKIGQPYTFRVSAKNLGDTMWLAKPNSVGGFVTVGARLHNAAKQVVEENYGRVHLSADVRPGETQAVEVALVAPLQKGVYHVELDMVCEKICWFSQRGSGSVWERIEVL